MGLDAVVYATPPPGEAIDPDRLALAEVLCADAGLQDRWYRDEPTLRARLQDDEDDEVATAYEWRTFVRYFSKTYPRGSWPFIRHAIMTLREALPECTVHYGNDADWAPLPEVDDAMIAGLDETFQQQ